MRTSATGTPFVLTAMVGLCITMSFQNIPAAVVYQYTGNNFTMIGDATPPAGTYSIEMFVAGSFTTSSSLDQMSLTDIAGLVTSYTFSDGRQTLSQDNSSIFDFQIGVGSDGLPNDWRITVTDGLSGSVQVGDLVSAITTRGGVDIVTLGVCTMVDLAGNCDVVDEAQTDSAFVTGDSGTWSAIPLPSVAWLFSGGLLAGVSWMRLQRANRRNEV